MNHKVVNCTTQYVMISSETDSVSAQNSWTVCGLVWHTQDIWGSSKGINHRESCLVNMVARTTHTWSTLETNSTGYGYHDNIQCMGVRTNLLEKCCVHMHCYQNDLILQMLQYHWFVTVPSNKPLLADCTLQSAFWRMECSKTTGLVKCFNNKHMLLHAVCHLPQCMLFPQLGTPDIPTSSDTTFYFSH